MEFAALPTRQTRVYSPDAPGIGPSCVKPGKARAFLQEGWVIANHILVSFHVAFISSVLAIPDEAATREAVLRFIFLSPETIISALFTYAVFHTAISMHELGHFLEAARLRALTDSIQNSVEEHLAGPFLARLRYLAGLFVRIPYGRAIGIKREGLNYYPDAPYNLAVAAAGPRWSMKIARVALPLALVLLVIGLSQDLSFVLNFGRILLGLGVVTGLDFLMADRGKYREFQRRERRASDAAAALPDATAWVSMAPAAKRRIVERCMQEAIHPRLGTVNAPWQFRNCGMGGSSYREGISRVEYQHAGGHVPDPGCAGHAGCAGDDRAPAKPAQGDSRKS